MTTEALSSEAIEHFVSNIYLMHQFFDSSPTTLQCIFQQLDAFISSLMIDFDRNPEIETKNETEAKNEIDSKYEVEAKNDDTECEIDIFELPNSITRLTISYHPGPYGIQIPSYDPHIITNAVNKGNVVRLSYKLPIGGHFDFRIVTMGDQQHAFLQHGLYDDGDNIISEEWMAIDDLLENVFGLATENWKLCQKSLFPTNSMNFIEMKNPVRPYWEITKGYIYDPVALSPMLVSQKIELAEVLGFDNTKETIRRMKDRITNAYWLNELGPCGLFPTNKDDTNSSSENCCDSNHVEENNSSTLLPRDKCTQDISTMGESSTSSDNCVINSSTLLPRDKCTQNISTMGESSTSSDNCVISSSVETTNDGVVDATTTTCCAPAVNAAVGFVFTGAGLMHRFDNNEKSSKVENIKKIAIETANGGISHGIGVMSKALGDTVFTVGGVTALASLALSSTYDGIKFARGKMTKVEYRKKTASNLGGAAGGLLGGLGTTLLVTFTVSNPVGWALALGAGAVGVAGGIAGAFGAKKIDKAIWDEGIDQIVHVYQFFDLDISRDEYPPPVIGPELLIEKYGKRVKENHDPQGKNKNDFDWLRKCQVLFMLLLRFMFPVYRDLLDVTSEWKEKYDVTSPREKVILQFFFSILEH